MCWEMSPPRQKGIDRCGSHILLSLLEGIDPQPEESRMVPSPPPVYVHQNCQLEWQRKAVLFHLKASGVFALTWGCQVRDINVLGPTSF